MSKDIITIDPSGITKTTDFKDIPANPETSNFWMINNKAALWFSSYDNRWRFMLLMPGQRARRSGESFATKKEAQDFYESRKTLTWMKGTALGVDE